MPRWETQDYSNVPMPSETDRAWAAGFWDGEGSTSLKRIRANEPLATHMRMYISQARNEDELIHRFLAIMGVGTVKNRPDRPEVWQWTCQDIAGCNRALDIMWPYLGTPKQEQARRSGYVAA